MKIIDNDTMHFYAEMCTIGDIVAMLERILVILGHMGAVNIADPQR